MDQKQLTKEERTFLQALLKNYREYYATLAGNSKCSPANRKMATFVETLYAKLNDANTSGS